MNKITMTIDLTPENLEILKQLCSTSEANEASSKLMSEPITLASLRTKATELITAGKKELVKDAGVEKLTQLKPEKYDVFLKELEDNAE